MPWCFRIRGDPTPPIFELQILEPDLSLKHRFLLAHTSQTQGVGTICVTVPHYSHEFLEVSGFWVNKYSLSVS